MGDDVFGANTVVVVREFDPNKDREGVEAVERICDVGPSGKLSLFTDLHGDPICRVRHSPTFLMLVFTYILKISSILINVSFFVPPYFFRFSHTAITPHPSLLPFNPLTISTHSKTTQQSFSPTFSALT